MIIIYKFSNAAGETIYVGATAHLNNRLSTHRREKPWWNEIAAIDVEMIDGIQPAADRETHLIRTIKPRYNSQTAGRYYGPLRRFDPSSSSPDEIRDAETLMQMMVDDEGAEGLTRIKQIRHNLHSHKRDAILAARANGETWQSIAGQLNMSVSGVRLASRTLTPPANQ